MFSEPSTAEKFIIAGFMLFALIVLTAYTASSAAALVIDDSSMEYASLDDVRRDPSAYLCIEEAIYDMFLGVKIEWSTKMNKERIMQYSNIDAILEGMDAGECVAAVMKEDAYLKITTDVEKTHCNKVITSELLFTVSNAYPVREELSKPFGYAVGELVNNGQYSKYRDERKNELLGEPFCGDEVNEDSGEFEKLDHDNLFVSFCLSEFVGHYATFKFVILICMPNILKAPMFISFSSTTIGLFVCFFPKFLKKRRLWTRKEEDAIRDDDDTPETVKCEDTLTTNTNSVSNVLINPSLTDILDILSSSSSKELDAAMEKLPDQSALLELCLQNNPIFLSNERLKDHLLSLTWSELLHLCRPIGQRTINEIMKYVSIYDKSNPKIRLQYTILTNPATRVALMQQLSDRLPLVSKNTGISTISSKTHSTGPPPNQQFDPVLSAYLNQISARSVATSADESNDSMARRKFDLETNPSNLYSERK